MGPAGKFPLSPSSHPSCIAQSTTVRSRVLLPFFISSTPYLPLLVSSSPVGPSQHLGISISHDLLSEPLPSKCPPRHWDIRPSHSSTQNLPDIPHLHSSHQERGSKQLKLALGFSLKKNSPAFVSFLK